MNCPLCAGPSIRLFSAKGYFIRSCELCGHQFAEIELRGNHVEVIYGDDYFSGGGAGYSDYLSEADLLRRHGRRYAKLAAKYVSRGKVLDVGAAAGFILQGFVEEGWHGTGIEANAAMAAYAREQLGLDVRSTTLEQFETEEKYDLVSMIQVAAHFVDPRAAFARAAQLTAPEGIWLIETWNVRSLTRKLFGSHWHEYSPPSVLHWFHPGSLEKLAEQFGFREVARGRPQKWLDGKHAKSLLTHVLHGSKAERVLTAAAAIIPDNLPIPYPAEDLFWGIYRRRGA